MSGCENMRIKEQNEFIQMIFEVIKQTHSGSEEEKDMLVLRNILNLKENSDTNYLYNSQSLEKTIRASCPLLGFHDPAVYELLQKGFTIGLDDLWINCIRKLLMKLRPVELSDIMAVRPLFISRSFMLGIENEYFKRKNGIVNYSYLHPNLKEVLCDTYGIFLYEEQIIKTAKIIAGFSKKQAKRFFKRLKKAKRAENDILCKTFVESSVKNWIEEDLAKKIFETLSSSTLYAVCKFKYAEIATCVYKLAYLKVHYYVEFITAYLNLMQKDYLKYIGYCDVSKEFLAQKYIYLEFNSAEKEDLIYETKSMGYEFTIPEHVSADKSFKTDGKTIWYE